MKPLQILVSILTISILAIPAFAAEFEGEADGPWIYMDTMNIKDEFEGDYLDYLGRGYVAILEAVKAEGIVLDYGVMVKFTGEAGDGDVVVWWMTNKLGDIEKVFDRLGSLAEEMYSDTELLDQMMQMSKIREMESTEIYRAITWKPVE